MASEKRKKFWIKIRNKYRLVIMNDDTLEEKLTFRLSRLNVFVALGTLAIVLIFLTSYLIAFTPLREYIPGYPNVAMQKKLYELQIKTDSIEKDLDKKELYLANLKAVINGENLNEGDKEGSDSMRRYNNIQIKKSPEDSMLRLEVENQSKYRIYSPDQGEKAELFKKATLGKILFFVPLKGVITSPFDAVKGHMGVDIVAKDNEAIKSVLDGTVILSNWTLETGYTIAVQHQQNIVSIYKHNSALLKKTGDVVKAGDPIAIIGQTGELSTGPHLHFELWNDGYPVNPKDYINF
ncbi:MAG: M23 family metallopeptidase [Syntrophothermus sp.]